MATLSNFIGLNIADTEGANVKMKGIFAMYKAKIWVTGLFFCSNSEVFNFLFNQFYLVWSRKKLTCLVVHI